MAILKNDGVDGVINIPRRHAVLRATGAITKGQVVQIDGGASAALKNEFGELYLVRTASGTDDTALAIGIATETVAAPAAGATVPVQVQIAGMVGTGDDYAPTSVAAIATLGTSIGASTTAGLIKVGVAPTTNLWPFAVLLKAYGAADTSGKIIITDRGWY